MRGIGEQLSDADVPLVPLVIAHTRRMLPTLDVFHELQESDWSAAPATDSDEVPRSKKPGALAEFLAMKRNDLEAPAIRLQPQIADLLRDIGAEDACLLARMSGSGAACFGIFETDDAAARAAIALEAKGWWAVATRLNG